MYCHETKIRIRYAETDQMGIVHHSMYALYYEESRTDAMRQLGYSYREIEEKGIFMPVVELKIHYLKPAYYDEILTIRTMIREMPASTIRFEYETFNSHNECINKGETLLAFVDRKTRRPVRVPGWLSEALRPHLSSCQ